MTKGHLYKIITLLFLVYITKSQTALEITAAWKNDACLRNALTGVHVADARSGNEVFSHQSQLALIPASTLKLVTTSAVLKILGPNFRFNTRICYTGEFDRATGTINGDIVIVGGGDPTLQSPLFYKEQITDGWAQVLMDKGVKAITGKIIGDASIFNQDIPGSWLWEDVSNYFGAAPCGLSYMENKFSILLTTGENGSSAMITGITPAYETQSLTISNSVIAAGRDDQAYVFGDPGSFTKQIKGSIPANKKDYEIEATLPDPALLCAEHLAASLKKKGISVQTKPTSNHQKNKYTDVKPLHVHSSPTLDKIVIYTNQQSNNLFCESMLLAAGNYNRQTGLQKIKSFWKTRGLDTNQLFMKDGCGLSRANSCTADLQTSLLHKIFADPELYRLMNPSLPLAGRQGSMSSIGKGTVLENNLRAKTGYMLRARAYCGFVTTKGGKELVFSIIFNHYNCTAAEARLKMEKLMLSFYDL
jgi:D-alanyl-D-alanine carboxypeptidase/D-alanyl-D-alanine-endopeptidase (penicillin-binding protein 4)